MLAHEVDRLRPVGTLGGSILLYRFDSAPVDAPGPTAPEGYCASDDVSLRTAG